MKRLTLLMVSFIGMFVLAGQSLAQCVQCLPGLANPNVFTCQGATSGGRECVPVGSVCTVAGTCRPPGGGGEEGGEEGGGSRLTQSSEDCLTEKIGKVEFDKNIIRQVGERHARLAIALASLNQSGLLGAKDVKIYLAPIEINDVVYNKWLDNISVASQKTALSAVGIGANKRERLPAPPKGAETIVYAVDVVSSENSTNKIIRFSTIKGSPSDATFTSLDLILEEIAPSDSAANSEKKWKVINWEIK